MPGAAIVIKGTNKGMATDWNGNFEIKAHQGDILVFSTIGYAPKEVKVGKEHNLNIVLSVDVLELEGTEVVAVAYGTTDKKIVYRLYGYYQRPTLFRPNRLPMWPKP